MRPGQDIVLMGFIGLEGTVQAVEKKEELLLTRLPGEFLDRVRDFRRYVDSSPAAGLPCRPGEVTLWEVGRGGIFTALWEMAEQYGVGLAVDLKRIPVRQETIEVCEILELNPYELLSGGCILIAADNGNDLIWESEIPAAFIGKVTDNRDRIVLNGDNIRYLNRPGPDEAEKLESR